MRNLGRYLVLTLLLSCASSSEQQNIVGGSSDNHVSVVFVRSILGTCSGSYLGSGLILTAAHCVPSQSDHSAIQVQWVDTENASTNVTVTATDHMTFQDHVANTTRDNTNDLAAVFVDICHVPSGAPALPTLDANGGPLQTMDIGTTLTEIGFGSTAPPSPGNPLGTGFGRNSGPTRLDSLSSFVATVKSTSAQAKACYGDSGGPLIVNRNGTEYVTGVLSDGATDCSGMDNYTRVDNNRNADFVGTAAAGALLSLHSCDPSAPPTTCTNSVSSDPAGVTAIALAAVLVMRRRRRPPSIPGASAANMRRAARCVM